MSFSNIYKEVIRVTHLVYIYHFFLVTTSMYSEESILCFCFEFLVGMYFHILINYNHTVCKYIRYIYTFNSTSWSKIYFFLEFIPLIYGDTPFCALFSLFFFIQTNEFLIGKIVSIVLTKYEHNNIINFTGGVLQEVCLWSTIHHTYSHSTSI